MLKLHDYQKRAINQILTNKHVFLMADVGLGKTVIALKAIEESHVPAIVFAPLAVCYSTWPQEIKKWTPSLTYTILHGSDKNTKITLNRDIYLINYDGLKWFFKMCTDRKFPLKKYFMVWDESSFVRSPSTQRFKLFKKMFGIFSNYRVCLSATPMPNGLHELWPQVFLLDRGKRLSASYYRFRDTYFHYTGPPAYILNPRRDAQEKIFEQIKDLSFRLDANDYLEMPSLTYNNITVKLPVKLQNMYNKLEKSLFLELGDKEFNVMSAAALTMKLRQFVQGFMYDLDGVGEELHQEKIKALKSMMEGAAGNPILAAIQFKHEVTMLRREVDKDLPVIAGGMSAQTKKTLIDDWNAGRLSLLCCHPASLGHGVNLQAGGHTLLWFANTWSQEHYQQLNGRLYRQGQKHGVVVNHFVCPNTIDEVMLKVVRSKGNKQQAFLTAINEYRQEKGYE